LPGACTGREPQEISAEYQLFVIRGQLQRLDLRQIDGGMQPWAVGAEQDLVRTRAPPRLGQEVEAANTRGIGVNIWVTLQMVN